MTTELDLQLRDGWVEAELAEEFPELRLVHAALAATPGPSPRELKERLRGLADRYTGAKVIHMRQDSVPWAYRVFSRQVGIDPDTDRTPVEAIALERLRHGGLKSENLLDDALTVATAETGVPIVALDTTRVEGELGLRVSAPGREARRGATAVALSDRDRGRAAAGGDRARRGGAVRGRHARLPPHDAVRAAGQGRAADQRRGGAVDRGGMALHWPQWLRC